jgi:hypothetical protein
MTSECTHHQLFFKGSMDAQSLEHEGTMVEVYSKMKPDTFKSQLQTVLTAYYEKIKRVVSASCCTKSWVVKRKFEDRTCARCLPRRPHRPRRRQRRQLSYPARRERSSGTRRGGASSCPQPWGQGRGRQGGEGRRGW